MSRRSMNNPQPCTDSTAEVLLTATQHWNLAGKKSKLPAFEPFQRLLCCSCLRACHVHRNDKPTPLQANTFTPSQSCSSMHPYARTWACD
mmetsp:Transcript_25379/g.55471  ORF Transcript_25379/g.55471 Transcript_25379/m.55471 type:complete len:90 (+) Transcript_25379:54-323(+)